MADIANLINNGVLTLGLDNNDAGKERTIIVLGAARGGTSMIAGALHKLGIYIGNNPGSVFEDIPLSEAVENNDQELIGKIIASRNLEHPIWGWKRPSSIKYLKNWYGRVRNPYYVVVFRDLFAIANRNRISMLSNVIADMQHNQRHYAAILDFLDMEQTAPRLLVSYEKAMNNTDNFVRELSRFVGVSEEERIESAKSFIRPNSLEYLKSSRITNSMGQLDRVTEKIVSGWVFYKQLPMHRVKVEIIINNADKYYVVADKYRADLEDKGMHPDGMCGFTFRLPKDKKIADGDVVSVRASGDIKDLRRSPVTLQTK